MTHSAAAVRLILVRHAEHVDYGLRLTGRACRVELSSAGRRQAAALGERLRREQLTEVHTSPRRRARDTAEAIAQRSGAPLRVEASLDEVDFGDWTGSAFEELDGRPEWDGWNAARGASRAPGGESMAEAVDRIARHAAAAAAERPGARIAFVSHCDMIRGFIAHCLGLPLDNLLRFEIAPASVSRVEIGAWGAHVLSLNEDFTTDGTARR